ncbi:shikimate dehydrogenase [Desulfitobacterium dichloroeliminans LMG P-21439]|uniref:Shikimate dehydrogenase (NADP(+)) n=1 Tax=Desulfitobacterium dichloroeliminans (strain LMG P-21439 / DCA1) TaxID=871963 RepID=L0F7R9_DESDL|nr:shikimate dehydrogenase [Desulfitobacterium dichloroeliminans LMG P-21439]
MTEWEHHSVVFIHTRGHEELCFLIVTNFGGIDLEKHFAVIGDPIAHSLSPIMHQAGYKTAGYVADYQKFQVIPEALGEAVQGLRALGFTGWNVTVPHKEAILPYLDELTVEAQRAGAVNTVKVKQGRLVGHNTDGSGLVRSLEDYLELSEAKKIVILGAGGAAKGIAMALAPFNVDLLILNRTPERAKELAQKVREYGGQASQAAWGPGEWIAQADCLIQTTSIGLKNESYPFSLEGIRPGSVVVDIIFNPWETPFLKSAKTLDCRVLNGIDMLLYQGVNAWEFWFEDRAPVEAMKMALYQQCKPIR